MNGSFEDSNFYENIRVDYEAICKKRKANERFLAKYVDGLCIAVFKLNPDSKKRDLQLVKEFFEEE